MIHEHDPNELTTNIVVTERNLTRMACKCGKTRMTTDPLTCLNDKDLMDEMRFMVYSNALTIQK